MTGIEDPAERRSALIPIIVSIVLVVGIGSLIGYLVQTGGGDWYTRLEKPDLTPPSQLFGIVWPVLYVLVGTAGGLVWAAMPSPQRSRALFWYGLQLVLNFAWTPVFFGLHQITIGLGVILALNVAAVVATVRMGRVRRSAAWLMVPYLVWIAFAAVLNFRIFQLNP